MSPFETALAERFHLLPPQVRQLHGARTKRWRGQVTVSVAANPLARMVCKLAGFPKQMDKAPFELALSDAHGIELWRRNFDGHETRSTLRLYADDLLEEEFGPVKLLMRPLVKVDQLHFEVVSARLFGRLSIPKMLVPRSDVSVWQDEAGRYRFDIRGVFPALGEAIRYQGWLLPAEAAPLAQV